MIVYREQSRTVPTAEVLARIEAAGNPLERLIEIGELEAGVADALSPDCDRDHPVLAALRRAAIRNEAPRIPGLPETITISVPEGYAYYALYPETYRMAARAFWNEARPARVAVLGIRSIGTSLSAVVAAELEGAGCEVHSWTVRPRGHPFDRRLIAESELQRRWRELAGAYFVVVDEGPGLSGSSFASVVAALSAAGVPEQRIVLFPSWTPDGSAFVSEAARWCWPRHRKYVASFEDLGMFPGARDLSSGNWRTCIGAEVAVQPQHERRKYLADGRLYKFAGLGRYGRGAFERAQVLAAAGFGPPVEELASGFVSGPWVSGRPLVPGDMTDDLLDVMARYLAFRSREFQCRGGSQLTEMIRVNVEEGLGLRLDLSPPDGHACAIDNRMFPHEWLRTASGYLKTDAVDHYDDHFYPGPQDIAWDLAAAAIEFDMDAEAATALASRYVAHSDDRGIHSRLPFHRLAWLAFRLGYADMAAGALGDTPDGARFRRQRERYAELLLREIRRYA